MTRKLQTGNEQYHNSRVDNSDANQAGQRTQSHNKSVNQPGSGDKMAHQGSYQYPDRTQGGSFVG
jgi:ribosomal protein L4